MSTYKTVAFQVWKVGPGPHERSVTLREQDAEDYEKLDHMKLHFGQRGGGDGYFWQTHYRGGTLTDIYKGTNVRCGVNGVELSGTNLKIRFHNDREMHFAVEVVYDTAKMTTKERKEIRERQERAEEKIRKQAEENQKLQKELREQTEAMRRALERSKEEYEKKLQNYKDARSGKNFNTGQQEAFKEFLEFVDKEYSSISIPPDAARRIGFLGTISAGKSTLINALVGKKVAESGTARTTTIVGDIHTFTTVAGQTYTYVDFPGPEDSSLAPSTNADFFSLQMLSNIKCQSLIVFVYSNSVLDPTFAKVVQIVNALKVPMVFVRNKVDLFDDEDDDDSDKMRQDDLNQLRTLLKLPPTAKDPSLFFVSAKHALKHPGDVTPEGDFMKLKLALLQ